MNKRPLSITVISWLFVATGTVGLVYHSTEFKLQHPFNPELLWVCLVRIFAILCGVFMLRGRNWARWGLVAWMGYHVGLSVLHTPMELIVHGLLFIVVAYFVFRPQAAAYFRGTTTGQKSPPDQNS